MLCPWRFPEGNPSGLHPFSLRYRDGEPITAKSSEIQISRDGEYYSMTFSNVKEAHQGNYSVMAKNSQGENSSSMHLTVYISQPEGDERGAETGVGDGDDAAGMRRVVLQETAVCSLTRLRNWTPCVRQMQADSDAFWGRDSDECRVQEISSEPWEGGRPERSARRPASQQSGIVQEFESDDGASEAATAAAGDSLHRQTHYQQVITTVIKASLPSEYSILGYVIVPDVSRRDGPEPTLVRYDLFGYRLPEIGRRPDLNPEDFDICGHALLHERSEADSGEYRPVDYAVFGRRALPGWQPPPVDSSLLGHITLRDWDSEGGGHTPFTLYGQRTLQDVLIDRGPRAGVHTLPQILTKFTDLICYINENKILVIEGYGNPIPDPHW
ncbi:hypothetical protein FJT64_017992 [Amphibalanus amphitrite]|uniref:Immunoglobulin I-set domain-containing protein n=1 Tax=Amphibalanus amphitrite TaxID=1232801 RepID=A0A6A4X9X0_AMPAM|nr:hypothetical protein FJT64_017992 [Amphibalanus amphitrite]